MNTNKKIAALLITLMLYTVAPTAITAASLELSASMKTALGKMTAAADSSLKGKINTLYSDLLNLQEQDQNWDARIKTLHYKNEETLIVLRRQIKQIDADKLNKLEIQVNQTRDRYKPLFALYTSLNKQIAAAKPLKNKVLNAMLRLQADSMKTVYQLARQDIRTKENALKAAKDSAAKTIKKIRETLADIDPINVQIKAERSATNTPRKRVSTEWINFKYAVKKSDAKSTLDSLTTLVPLSHQIVYQKQKIHTLEKKISDTILKAKAQIPSK